MAIKKTKKPVFTVTVKTVVFAEVPVEADTFEQALEIARSWKSDDIVTLDDSATEADSRIKVVSVFSPEPWGTD